jgi:DNA-binding MarR family transcriptional regulator
MTDDGVAFSELAELLTSPLDPVLTDPTRLRIQAALYALPPSTAMSFTILRKALGLTDGNLGMHVRVLIDAGFVATEERWRGKRRTTLYEATSAGRAAFDAHVRALNAIIRAAGLPSPAADQHAAASGEDRPELSSEF